jgi:hypothetical protein
VAEAGGARLVLGMRGCLEVLGSSGRLHALLLMWPAASEGGGMLTISDEAELDRRGSCSHDLICIDQWQFSPLPHV